MLLERRIFAVKPGKVDRVVRLMLDEHERSGFKGAHRVLTPLTGEFDRVCMEGEFVDWDDRNSFWKRWAELPTTPTFMAEWNTLIETGGSCEIWELRR